ncbi:uncharacterized protein LOC127568547 [Pristis pectinata]|uniref:uncharacterized protein LOC127568547 n=1 Tax=Pristis pectinata TaxID=685728 RepID=UPI00223D0EB8|nr:uncharacterized protein LOC127568547 [Pristis pectinata]XP_051868389.1 uncharacterized protein LOC127568547 [Pristis pectinata]
MAYINSSLPDNLNPLQFAYQRNRSTADAISLALHSALEHLDSKDTYVRLLFIDYSSAFNTIIPSKLVTKLRDLGLNTSLCNWILDFLTIRPQSVRIGSNTSDTIILNTGAPQKAASSALYSLYTRDCVARFCSNSIYKFADDTTIVGRISNSDESEYRKEIESLVEWCHDNNVNKTKELVIDFRKGGGVHAPVYISGAEVERVESFKFLGVNVTNSLSWSNHVDAMAKKAHQRLYFLRRLKKFGLSPLTLTNFY